MHGKLSTIRHSGEGVFEGLANNLQVTRYHSLMLDRTTLPDCLTPTAETDDGLLMGVQHTHHPVHGVLFHPESIASEAGHAILANFLDMAGLKRHKTVPQIERPEIVVQS